MSDDSDSAGPKTPPQTPSAMHKLGLVPCPKCRGTRTLCDLCNEGGAVAVDTAIKWTLEHGDTEPPSSPKQE